jgi:hypothetical protein
MSYQWTYNRMWWRTREMLMMDFYFLLAVVKRTLAKWMGILASSQLAKQVDRKPSPSWIKDDLLTAVFGPKGLN